MTEREWNCTKVFFFFFFWLCNGNVFFVCACLCYCLFLFRCMFCLLVQQYSWWQILLLLVQMGIKMNSCNYFREFCKSEDEKANTVFFILFFLLLVCIIFRRLWNKWDVTEQYFTVQSESAPCLPVHCFHPFDQQHSGLIPHWWFLSSSTLWLSVQYITLYLYCAYTHFYYMVVFIRMYIIHRSGGMRTVIS